MEALEVKVWCRRVVGSEVDPFRITNDELIDAPRKRRAKCLNLRDDSFQRNSDQVTSTYHRVNVFLAFTDILYDIVRLIL